MLRIAVYEMLHQAELPEDVIINEAVELAKEYSTDDSGRFVNGILGALSRRQAALANPVEAKPKAEAAPLSPSRPTPSPVAPDADEPPRRRRRSLQMGPG